MMVKVAGDHFENQSSGEQKPKVLQHQKCVLFHQWPWKFAHPRQETQPIELFYNYSCKSNWFMMVKVARDQSKKQSWGEQKLKVLWQQKYVCVPH